MADGFRVLFVLMAAESNRKPYPSSENKTGMANAQTAERGGRAASGGGSRKRSNNLFVSRISTYDIEAHVKTAKDDFKREGEGKQRIKCNKGEERAKGRKCRCKEVKSIQQMEGKKCTHDDTSCDRIHFSSLLAPSLPVFASFDQNR